MKNNLSFFKILSIIGLILVWTPIIFPIIISIIGLVKTGKFLFDFLFPAEMFIIVLVGSASLLLVAWKIKYNVKSIGFGLITAVVLLFGSQILATITGLASGEMEPKDGIFALVVGGIVLYDLIVIEIGVAGLYLVNKLIKLKK
ncbi:MAG: hypothetical protein ACK4R7_00305 [Fervidobacterium sp.]